ncbi:unnamed protein product [Prorocentrum cordatum]|uniref:Uncharacterized protein n=1 Tax=Prorocentrum cordatum TaxID=2364126 RepID=A0ABN9TH05_9DINO|nr:unnamed protein product [Polarella glacialis]
MHYVGDQEVVHIATRSSHHQITAGCCIPHLTLLAETIAGTSAHGGGTLWFDGANLSTALAPLAAVCEGRDAVLSRTNFCIGAALRATLGSCLAVGLNVHAFSLPVRQLAVSRAWLHVTKRIDLNVNESFVNFR